MIRLFYKGLFGILLCLHIQLLAKEGENESANIHTICQNNYSQCIELLPEHLAIANPGSRVWFTLKLYQLEALFALERFSQLKETLETVVHLGNLPTKFKINSYILYAKLIKNEGQEPLAVDYLNQAKETLLAINESWPKPIEFVQIANLLNSLGQYQDGYNMLLDVEKKFTESKNPAFYYQLYTNLGHFAMRLGKHQQHIDYRLKALSWVKESDNLNHLTIALFNVARAYFFIEEDAKSLVYFEQMLPVALSAGNHSLVNKAYINMGDIYARGTKYKELSIMLNKVQQDDLTGDYIKRLQRLQQIQKNPAIKLGKK